jgi:hypothetical protein
VPVVTVSKINSFDAGFSASIGIQELFVSRYEAAWAYPSNLKVWHEAPFQLDDVKLATLFAHFVSFVISATEYINMLLAILVGDSKK